MGQPSIEIGRNRYAGRINTRATFGEEEAKGIVVVAAFAASVAGVPLIAATTATFGKRW
jgi:hypothetical protein